MNVDEQTLKMDDGTSGAKRRAELARERAAAEDALRREGDVGGHPVTLFGPELSGTPRLAIFLSTRDIMEAEMKAGWLGANGIPCIVTGRMTSSAVFGNMFDAARMNILVPEDKLEEAEGLIEVLETGGNLSLAEGEE